MNLSIHKVKKNILMTFLSLLFLLILSIIFLYNLGTDFLVVDDSNQLENSDVIIVLSGEQGRLPHAAELYEQGLADHVLLTNAKESGTTKERALSLGIPSEAIIEETESASTYDNVNLTKKIVNEHEFNSAIVVTSNYHSRRTKMTFENIYDEIDLSYSFSPSFFDPEDGLSEKEKMMTFSEYVKIIGYSARLLFQ